MIISENGKPELTIFQTMMAKTDFLLNDDAAKRENYYEKRSGKPLENDVYWAACEAAKGTPFEGSIQLVSGASFPDIIAHKYYGIEVKSTEKNHWTSTGSSILESTRNADVSRIYLTFGKLGKPVKFLSRPYEECLSGIAVTHYPRYLIDMRLKKGDTIFDKMGISYDELRIMDNPVAPVSKYYKNQLKPGETLWWAQNETESTIPPTVKIWSVLPMDKQNEFRALAYALCPEILGPGSSKKYNRFALWLVIKQGIVCTNIRDIFSAGGQVNLRTKEGVNYRMPAAFGRIHRYHDLIKNTIYDADVELFKEYWNTPNINNDRLSQWIELAASAAASPSVSYSTAINVLKAIF